LLYDHVYVLIRLSIYYFIMGHNLHPTCLSTFWYFDFTKWIRIGGTAMSEAFCMPLLPMELECLLYCTWLHNCSLDLLLVCCYILACWLLGSGLDHFSLFLIYIYIYIYIFYCCSSYNSFLCTFYVPHQVWNVMPSEFMNICWGLFTTMMGSAVHGFRNYAPRYFLYDRHWRFLSLSFTNSSGGQNVLCIADKLLSCLLFSLHQVSQFTNFIWIS
jgi:hypothetical protein